ncbi:putative glycoprotein 3-alpha-L-fucosyltransferase [Phlyctochytrium planicorne]|nr:putative glycoprotein 3-alpha-L-fucosyltransferase [Phlyctochytrium planicorne]
MSCFEEIAHATLLPIQPLNPNTSPLTKGESQALVTVALRPPKVVYEHSENASYFSSNITVQFSKGLVCDGKRMLRLHSKAQSEGHVETGPIWALSESSCARITLPKNDGDVSVGYGPQATIQINLIERAYSDFFDFAAVVKDAFLNGRTYYKRIRGMVAFTPPCSRLHPGAINYLARLRDSMNLHIYGSCLATHTLDRGRKLNDNQRARLANRFHFVLVWEEHADVEGYVSEEFFKALAYSAVPVIWGPTDVERFLPAANSFVFVREYLDNPQGLAEALKVISSNVTIWRDMMSWRNANTGWELKEPFLKMWDWSLKSSICSVCGQVAKTIGAERLAARQPLVNDRSAMYDFILKHAYLETRNLLSNITA